MAASVTSPGGCAPLLAHVPSLESIPRGSLDFLAHPVPKACMHVLGTGVPRCLDVARSACNRCIVVDLCCNCEACSLDAPGVVTPDTAPGISEPT